MKPLAKIRPAVIAVLVLGLLLGGCSTAPVVEGDEPEYPAFPADQILAEDVAYVGDVYDPWEGLNRVMYRFNYYADAWVLLPLVRGYQAITPGFLEKGISNFFRNYRNITVIINSLLQFSGRKTGQTTGRFVVNTTIGILGLFDPATRMGIPQHQEDFGQTLGRWGVGPGPYIVLPLLGPSSLRDGVGAGVDWVTITAIRDEVLNLTDSEKLIWALMQVIDTRANVAFRYYETGSPYEYQLVRMLYTTKREMDIAK